MACQSSLFPLSLAPLPNGLLMQFSVHNLKNTLRTAEMHGTILKYQGRDAATCAAEYMLYILQ